MSTESQPADRAVASSHGSTAAPGRGTQGAGAAPTWQTPPPLQPGGLRDPPKKHGEEDSEKGPIEEPQGPESLIALLEGKTADQPSGPYKATDATGSPDTGATLGRHTLRRFLRGSSTWSSPTRPPLVGRRASRRP
jgi:hypothetical protein